MINEPLILHARWFSADAELLHGFDNTNHRWIDEDLVLGLANPNMVTAPIEVFLRSSASLSGSDEILNNVRLYLTGAAANVKRLLEDWPPTQNGLEVSFDNGTSWRRFGTGAGNPSDPTTWIPMPACAVSSVAVAGRIGPMDTAKMLFRLSVGAVPASIFSRIQIGVDWDVL